jgi:hypothetical protein
MTSISLRLLAFLAVAVVVLAGVWAAGGVITDSFEGSLALTTVWFGVSGLVCLAIAVRRRALRVPVLGAYMLVAAVAGGYLGWSTLNDRVVDERVAVGMPLGAEPAGATTDSGDPDAGERSADPPRNVELAAARFRSGEHATTGRAAIVRLAEGGRVLTLTDFDTSAGPDLRVRLVPGRTSDGAAPGAVDLGALKGNRGDQQYDLPGGARTAGATVVIWCRAFSAVFGHAPLERSVARS